MDDAQRDLNPATLATICRQAFPELDSSSVADFRRISDGWECDVYRVDLQGVRDGLPVRRDLILRVYLGNGAVPKSRHEFQIMRTLHQAGYPVPRVDALLAEDSPIGQPLVLMERVDGLVLGPAMITASDDRERERYFDLFCRLLADLHALDWQPFVSQPEQYRPGDAPSRWVTGMRNLLAPMNATEFDEALDWLDERALLVDSRRLSLVHWDFHPWNVLLRSNGDPAVIDWTTSEVTDPRFDVAWTLLLVQATRGQMMRDAVLARYERYAGSPVADLAFFQAAASLRRVASIVISLEAGSEVFGMRAGAEEQMLADLTHLATAYDQLQSITGLRIASAERVLSSRSE